MIYNFREPRRGDISVFETTGITFEQNSLRGKFYVKRLVGLPGETIRIYKVDTKDKKKGHLYVKNGDSFELVDKSHHPAFGSIYSGKGGYHGYTTQQDLMASDLSVIDSINNSTTEDKFSLSMNGRNNPLYQLFEWDSQKKAYIATLEDSYKDGSIVKKGDQYVMTVSDATYYYSIYSESQYRISKFVRNDGYEVNYTDEYYEYKIPKGHYFMLGDNSKSSLDSRFWGTVPRSNILGTAMFVWWPFTRRWGVPSTSKALKYDTLRSKGDDQEKH